MVSGNACGCGRRRKVATARQWWRGMLNTACRLGALAAVALSLGLAPAAGQDPKRPWLDPTLLAAAQKEGPLVVYSSMNEQEGLPLFKIFTEATGIKVNYVRGSDTQLMGRIAIEFRTKQKAWDIIQTTTINKMPPPMLAQVDLSEGKALSPMRATRIAAGTACTPTTTARLQYQAGEARRAAEDLRGVPDQEAVGEPRRDRRHRQRMAEGDVRALWRAARHRDHQGHRRDAESGRHRRPSRAGARHRRRRIRDLAEQLRQPVDEREACRRPDRRLGDGPGRADVRPGRRECARAQSQRGEAGGELHDQPGGPAVHRQVRPPADTQRRNRQSARHGRDAQAEEGHPGAADAARRKRSGSAGSRNCSGRGDANRHEGNGHARSSWSRSHRQAWRESRGRTGTRARARSRASPR